METPVENMLREKPLIRFSFYTASQVDILKSIQREILNILDSSISVGRVDDPGFLKVYGLFWLWVLDAFEVVRTMESAKECFSESVRKMLKVEKLELLKIRTPFAKQQFAGRSETIRSELSITNIDTKLRDFKFEIEGKAYFVRNVMDRFISAIERIGPHDVIKSY